MNKKIYELNDGLVRLIYSNTIDTYFAMNKFIANFKKNGNLVSQEQAKLKAVKDVKGVRYTGIEIEIGDGNRSRHFDEIVITNEYDEMIISLYLEYDQYVLDYGTFKTTIPLSGKTR